MARPHSRPSAVVDTVGTIVIAVALLATVLVVRGRANPVAVVGAGQALPATRMAVAADLLEARLAPTGAGYTFEIVQRSTIHAKPDGPQIEIPDPVDPHKSLGFADKYPIGALIERGAVTPAGFSMEMRAGPAPDKDPDWSADYQFGAIVKDGKTYRDDGAGWYLTDDPPGVGLDPRTAGLLPTLLRTTTDATDAGSTVIDGLTAPVVTGSAKPADFPGVIASDGEPFTELNEPIDYAFDEQGRLLRLHVVARNANLKAFDLLVEVTIDFAYPLTGPDIPAPEPVRKPAAAAHDRGLA